MPLKADPLVYEAFRTPGGLTPQEAMEHKHAYAQQQGQAAQLDRRTNGVWRDVPYSAGLFIGESGHSVVIDRTAPYCYRYKLIGPELHLRWMLVGNLGAAMTTFQIVLPEGLKIKQGVECDGNGWGQSGVGYAVGVYGAPGSKTMHFFRVDQTPWSAGFFVCRGNTQVEVQ
jgi:hypothetical protein